VPQSALYLKLVADSGLEGFYGAVDPEAAIVVARQLKGLVVGQDALAGEILWDRMYRWNRHSRRGHYMMALSAIDNALWDLRGKHFGAPVYVLLGGPSKPEIEAYASCLGFPLTAEELRRRSIALKNQGYQSQKWFFSEGPAAGGAGLLRNVELVRSLREALGEDYEIMFDAYSGWDVEYAIAWARQAEKYRPAWIEEIVQSDKIEAFSEFKKKTSIPVATGEHFYGRWEVYDFMKAGAIDVIQADPEWCGGVSELLKICALASLHDLRVVPHGHNIHAALHVVASQSPMTCPMVEYLVNFKPQKAFFEKQPLAPAGGKIRLPDRPGFGIEIDQSKVERAEQVWASLP
jgi:L-alanine-DL-glutamate epimerase-like enolase superfamily enzyme